jgi:thiol-disulfide isomerase/thioredoxin
LKPLFYSSYIALWALLLIQGVLILLLYRHFGLMAMGTAEGVQRDGLAVGQLAPAFSGVTADGREVQWEPLLGSTQTLQLLLFAAPECEPCARILPYVELLAKKSRHVSVTAVVHGPRESAVRLAEKFNPSYPCIAEDGSGAFDRFRVRVTPFAFAIDRDGRVVAKGLCSDAHRLTDLLKAAGVEDDANVLDQPAFLASGMPEISEAEAHS